MNLEPAEEADSQSTKHSIRCSKGIETSEAVLPHGRRIRLLKTLITSVCERDCRYCPFRAGNDLPRYSMKPAEFAQLFMNMHRAGIAQGLFVSSGVINGGVYTQDRLIEVAEILRYKHDYRGYLHLKIMPGAEKAQVERAMQLADRVSVNLEAPNPARLQKLAPRKQFIEELLQPLQWIEEIRRTQPMSRGWNGCWPSSTTQFVAGGVGESDFELLETSQYLFQDLRLKRVYYSPFRPIEGTPMESYQPFSYLREHRLYQASFMLRDYGFKITDFIFEGGNNLPLEIDPKMAWARVNLVDEPVEINRASYWQLIRVPGIGVKGAKEILRARQIAKLNDLSALAKIGIQVRRAAPFILLNGKRQVYQMSFL